MRIIFEMEPNDEKQASPERSQKGPQDVWRFGEIRKTLWGEQPTLGLRHDVWDFAGIRKSLWGR